MANADGRSTPMPYRPSPRAMNWSSWTSFRRALKSRCIGPMNFVYPVAGPLGGPGQRGSNPFRPSSASAAPPVSIDIRHAWVEFPIFDAKSRSLKLKKAFLGKAGGVIGRNTSNVVVIEALRDISLSLRTGDRVGLVGHNGAGKSTLLRLLSGIYEPTRGCASVRGRVAPIFDLGIGMDPEICGYENILIRGLFLGETRKTMPSKVDEIAEFTELGAYLSMPLRTYSTGMRVRLAIGVVTSIDPEILLLDEAIGSVDAKFLHKALARLQNLVERSGILVFAAHSNEFLARVCKTAVWIDHGQIRMMGGIEEVIRAYEGEEAAHHVARVLTETSSHG
jgi:ABC-2 type transport system ATP-binding protein